MNEKLPSCIFCKSTKTKKSITYPSDWFCQDCKKGGLISNFKEKLDEKYQEIKIDNSFIKSEDPFSVVKRDKNGNVIDIIYWEI